MSTSRFTLPLALILLLLCSPVRGGEVDAAAYLDAKLPDCGIGKAIAALGPDGGVVLLPEGTFVLRRSIMLPGKVTLQGRGPDKTILTMAAPPAWVKITAVDGLKFTLEALPPGLHVGATVFLYPRRPVTGWLGYYTPQIVTAIEDKTVTVDGVKHNAVKAGGFLAAGLCSVLIGDCLKGAAELAVADAFDFVVGQAVAVGSGDGNQNESLSFIKEIQGNKLILERPIRIDHKHSDAGFWRRPAVWSLFPLITAETASGAVIKDLGLDCPIPADERPKLTRYTLSAIHLSLCRDTLVENVHVRNAFADGISVQDGAAVTVRKCLVEGAAGNGFHPGTGLTAGVFEDNISRNNGAGLYFCWHNRKLVLRRNQLVGNRGGGITGLGNPGDVDNLIEDNLIADNGGPGIEINGGRVSRNVIRNNVIRDNSRSPPGKHPGIAITAATEDARGYTIEGNTIESTSATPSQWVGIAEANGAYQEKPTFADENVIRGNHFRGHQQADVVVLGEKTVVEEKDPAVKIVRRATTQPATQPK